MNDKTFIIIFAAIIGGVGLSIWKAYVVTCIWAWYVVPFFDAPSLPLVMAFGLSLLMSLFTYQIPDASSSDSDPLASVIGKILHFAISYTFILFMGWVTISMWPV